MEGTELLGLVLEATIVPQHDTSTFRVAIDSKGQFVFTDVKIVALYGKAYRLRFQFFVMPPGLPAIEVSPVFKA